MTHALNPAPRLALACMLLAALLLPSACLAAAANPNIAVVDVEKVLKESKTSDKARAHLARAKQRLEDGWKKLQQTWGNMPEKERKQVYANGLQALNRQLANEEAAANQVVLALMRDKVQEWRRKSRVACVLPKQNALAFDTGIDVTNEIISLMDKVEPKFAELPTVTVHQPKAQNGQTGQAAQGNGGKTEAGKDAAPRKR